MNPRMARNAIKLAAMLATRPIDADAPLLAASKMFCSSLERLEKEVSERTVRQAQRHNEKTLKSIHTHPQATLIFSSEQEGLFLVSG